MKIYNVMGWGKGKTTSAIGIAARALGNDEKILFCQFLKNGNESALNILSNHGENLNFLYLKQDTKGFELEDCTDFWNACMAMINSENPSLVIFDELNVALDYKLFDYTSDEMIDWLKALADDRDILKDAEKISGKK